MRVDFPYRMAGRRIPDRAPVLIQAVRDALVQAARLWKCETHQIVIGGRSMGGRMCTLAVSGFDGNERSTEPVSEPITVAGVVCVSYPLHPPGKPDRLRVVHFPYVAVPTLFLSGTRDEFATPDELHRHLAVLGTAPTIHLIDGGRHDLRGKDSEVAERVAQWVGEL
jgi:predicted alpha/beta-hydrolase family hydrolase